MKLTDKKFLCGWCNNITVKNKLKDISFKGNSGYGQVICDYCKRYISQKTRMEVMI